MMNKCREMLRCHRRASSEKALMVFSRNVYRSFVFDFRVVQKAHGRNVANFQKEETNRYIPFFHLAGI